MTGENPKDSLCDPQMRTTLPFREWRQKEREKDEVLVPRSLTLSTPELRKRKNKQTKMAKKMGSQLVRVPGRETSSQDENAMDLTSRLLDFAPGVTGATGEQLTEKQETALKKATVYFYKQLMLQQSKAPQLPHISLESSSSEVCRICRGAESKEELLTTCRCKGTMRFIHLSCLEHWLAESGFTKCELCSFEYQIVRTPKYSIIKSIILWLQNPGRRRDAREIMLDFLALIVFTPMAFFGTYLALLAADTWYNTEDSVLVSPTLTRIVSLGCLGVIGAIDTAYLSWLLLRLQHHARAWHRWRSRNCFVKVILSPPKSEENNNSDASNNSTNNTIKAEEIVSVQTIESNS